MRHRERAVGAVELELAQSVAATEERSEDVPDVGRTGAPEQQAATTVTQNVSEHV